MPTIIDLSASELKTASVVALIKDHVESPGNEPVLFKVNRDVMDQFRTGRPTGIDVSPTEAAQINRFVGTASSQYRIGKQVECSGCGRMLTFYDIFETGLKTHGVDFVKHFISGNGCHIQVHRKNPRMQVTCTKCGASNAFDDGCYETDDYTYA